MVDAVTNNYSLVQPLVGGDLNTWGGVLNNGTIAATDSALGSTFAVSITSLDVTLTTAQFQNAVFNVIGILTGNHSLIVPLSPNSMTVACGGRFVVVNNTTGNFNLTVISAASGSTGVIVPQGGTAFLYSDGTNVGYSANGLPGYVQASNGNPNGQLAGVAASVNTNAQLAFDYINAILYACATTGTSTTAVWTNVVAGSAPLPVPQGYLTPVSGTPIITADSIAATTIYYTPYQGDWTIVNNGLLLVAYKFSEMPLVLSSSQAANNIYDVFLAWNSGSPVIGTGPSWAAGTSGSVTAGSCARGTGAGGTTLTQSGGVNVNAVSISLIYNVGLGNNTITVAAGQGVYLGSLYIDGTAGQVTCHRSFGQSRKWGISNTFNLTPVILKAGDPTATWNYVSATIRPSNGSTANSGTVFCGLPITEIDASFNQTLNNSGASSGTPVKIYVGWNSTSTGSGIAAAMSNSNGSAVIANASAQYVSPPVLGINVATCLEQSPGVTTVFSGTQSGMQLLLRWSA